MKCIFFSYSSPKHINKYPQSCLGRRKDGAHQKRPLEQVLRQSVTFHPSFERITGVSLSSGNDKLFFCFLLDQPEIQKEQITEINHYPLDIPGQSQMPKSCCSALHSADSAIKKKGQQLPKSDPKPIKTFFRSDGRLFRRLDDGGWITGEHQPGAI